MQVTARQWYGLRLFLIAGFLAACCAFGVMLIKQQEAEKKLLRKVDRIEDRQDATTDEVTILKAEVEGQE